MIEAKLPPSSPTATHVVGEVGVMSGAHETARTFVNGAYDAAVCQVGAAAAEGVETRGLATTMPIASRVIAAAWAETVMLRTVSTAPPPSNSPRVLEATDRNPHLPSFPVQNYPIPGEENGAR
jgi:hypothetical protein